MDKPLFSYINWGLVVCIILLFGVGELNLYSASGARIGSGVTLSDFYQRQFIWGLCGLGCMLLTMSIDYHRLRSLAWPFYIITLVLLALVPLIGTTVYGAKRWISLGFMSLQPSELAKISVFLLSARLLSRNGEPLGWKEFGSIVLMGLVPAAFIIKQPDLGSALMLLLILAGMILFHGIRKIIFKVCALAAPCILFLMWNVGMHDYQRQRILTFLNPDADPLGTGYHILQSRIAIGSGQMWGKGFTEGTQSQLHHPVQPVPALHLLNGHAGQRPVRLHALRRSLLLLFLGNLHQYRHGSGYHARGWHSSPLHQLRRIGHHRELYLPRHRPQRVHAPVLFQDVNRAPGTHPEEVSPYGLMNMASP